MASVTRTSGGRMPVDSTVTERKKFINWYTVQFKIVEEKSGVIHNLKFTHKFVFVMLTEQVEKYKPIQT